MSQYIARSVTAIDCPACERMGRVVVILPNGTLTTDTCGHCAGHGFIEPCSDPGCAYCLALEARVQPCQPMFTWSREDVYS